MEELLTKLNNLSVEVNQLIDNVTKKIKAPVTPKINIRFSKKLNKDKVYIYDQQKYNKQYYQKNKDKYKIKHICDDCKGLYTLATKSYHFKSKKHNKMIQNNNIISGIKCNDCKNELAPMSMSDHLNGNFNKVCPHTTGPIIKEIRHRTTLDDLLN
jgi:hypothetical protein